MSRLVVSLITAVVLACAGSVTSAATFKLTGRIIADDTTNTLETLPIDVSFSAKLQLDQDLKSGFSNVDPLEDVDGKIDPFRIGAVDQDATNTFIHVTNVERVAHSQVFLSSCATMPVLATLRR